MTIPGVSLQIPMNPSPNQGQVVPIRAFQREPNSTDVKYPIGFQVIIGKDPISGEQGDLWYLSNFDAAGNAVWKKFSSGAGFLNFQWQNVTATTASLEANNGYFANNAAGVTLSLPAFAQVGDTYVITNVNAGGFIISQNDNQNIRIGTTISSVGVGGNAQSTALGDTLILTCYATNTGFIATFPPQGNITLV